MHQALHISNQPGSKATVANIPIKAKGYNLPSYCANTTQDRFVGRTQTLEDLLARLSMGNSKPLNFVIYGLNGVGKSRLACQVVKKLREQDDSKFSYFIWLDGEQNLEYECKRFALELGVDIKMGDKEISFEEIVKKCFEKLAMKSAKDNNAPILIVLDNVKNQEQIESLISYQRSSAIQIVVTSISMHWSTENFLPITLEVFNDIESKDFIDRSLSHDYAFNVSQMDEEQLNGYQILSTLSGNLPLALEQMTSYVRMKNISMHDFKKLYQNTEKQLSERQRGKLILLANEGKSIQGLHRKAVFITLVMTFNAIHNTPAAVDLLKLCGFVASHDIPAKLLQAHLNPQTSLADIINLLQNYSVITEARPKLFEVHTLVQEVLRLIVDVNASKTYLSKLINYLHSSAQAKSSAQHYIEPDLVVKHSVVVSQRAIDYQLYQDALYDFANTVFEERYLDNVNYGYDRNIDLILQNLLQNFNKDDIKPSAYFFEQICLAVTREIVERVLNDEKQNWLQFSRYVNLISNMAEIATRNRNYVQQAIYVKESIYLKQKYTQGYLQSNLFNKACEALHVLCGESALYDWNNEIVKRKWRENHTIKSHNGQHSIILDILIAQALAYRMSCAWTASASKYKEILKYLANIEHVLINDKQKYIVSQINAHDGLAYVLAELGNFTDSLAHIDEAIRLSAKLYSLEEHDKKLSLIYNKMRILILCGKVPEAGALLNTIQQIHATSGRLPDIPDLFTQYTYFFELAMVNKAETVLQEINNALEHNNLREEANLHSKASFFCSLTELILAFEPSKFGLEEYSALLESIDTIDLEKLIRKYKCNLVILEYGAKLHMLTRGYKIPNASYKNLEDLVNDKDLFQPYEVNTARAHWLLAKFYLLDYRLAEAELQLALALSIQTLRYEKHHNPELDYPHPDLARTYRELAAIHLINQQLSDADVLLNRAITLFKHCYKTDNHPEIAYTLQVQGDLLFSQHNYEQAAKLYLQSFQILSSNVTDTHPAIREAFLNYTNALLLSLRQTNGKAAILQEYPSLVGQLTRIKHFLVNKLIWQVELTDAKIGTNSATLFNFSNSRKAVDSVTEILPDRKFQP